MHKRSSRSTPRDHQYQPLRDLTLLHQYQPLPDLAFLHQRQPLRNLAFRRLRMSRLQPLAHTNGHPSQKRSTTEVAP
jgi:hypothetical protein